MGKSILNIVLFGLAAIVAIVLLLVLVLILYSDYCKAREFNHANRVKARITQKAGIQECANYGKGQANTRYIAYDVEYFIDGIQHTGIHLEKKDSYNVGDTLDVRYICDEKNEYKIVNRDIKDRFYRLIFSTCMAILLIGVTLILKRAGYI